MPRRRGPLPPDQLFEWQCRRDYRLEEPWSDDTALRADALACLTAALDLLDRAPLELADRAMTRARAAVGELRRRAS